jgi:hypothetical protein
MVRDGRKSEVLIDLCALPTDQNNGFKSSTDHGVETPKVGGSIPPPTTNTSEYFNNLEARSLTLFFCFAEVLPRMKYFRAKCGLHSSQALNKINNLAACRARPWDHFSQGRKNVACNRPISVENAAACRRRPNANLEQGGGALPQYGSSPGI